MKWTLLSFGILLAILIAMAAHKGDGTLQEGFQRALKIGGAFLPVLLIAFLITGFVEVLLPKEFVKLWLSDTAGFRGVCIAWLAGALTPAGSIIGLPIAASLYQAGVGIGVLVTYLTSLAVLSLIRLPIEIGIYGYKLTLLRVLASLLLPPIAGYTARFISHAIIR